MYKNLSKHGRFGDTEMVKTSSGSLWHVNKLEKKLIEKHGKLGEKLLDNISPSTINPKTGKEEKWLAAAAMFGLGLIQQYDTTRDARAQGREQNGRSKIFKNTRRNGKTTSTFSKYIYCC